MGSIPTSVKAINNLYFNMNTQKNRKSIEGGKDVSKYYR